MADTASLEKLADCYPPLVGWCRCSEEYRTNILLNGHFLRLGTSRFPLQARVRVYEGGEVVAQDFSPEIEVNSYVPFSLNRVLGDRTLLDGYFELTLFSKASNGLEEMFFSEVWSSVVSSDGKMALSYPMVLGRGADDSMIDASYLYYPGLVCDQRFDGGLVVFNHQEFENEYQILIYDASGRRELQRKFAIGGKSVQLIRFSESFPGLEEFLQAGPGMLVFHYKYKLNAFIQTWQRLDNVLTGMDHLGIIYSSNRKTWGTVEAVPQALLEKKKAAGLRRLEDRLICYCKGISEGEVCRMMAQGASFESVRGQTGAGTVCKGCVPDLERLMGCLGTTVTNWERSS